MCCICLQLLCVVSVYSCYVLHLFMAVNVLHLFTAVMCCSCLQLLCVASVYGCYVLHLFMAVTCCICLQLLCTLIFPLHPFSSCNVILLDIIRAVCIVTFPVLHLHLP